MATHLLIKKPNVRPLSKALQVQKLMFDDLVLRYKTMDYIPNDPISHPHRFLHEPKTCEMVAFVSALLSYGRRDIIINTVKGLLARMDDDPWGFLAQFDPKRDEKLFKGFIYRFNKAPDIIFLLNRLQWAYREYESLENLFIEATERAEALTLQSKIGAFLDALTGLPAKEHDFPSYGLKFLFAHPINGGACKRFNMFLRWVVRQDEHSGEPKVDLGLWQRALSPAELVIPLDTHVNKMNRHFGFTQRQSNSWETADEITDIFRRFNPEDPIRYDYALMGYSLSGDWAKADKASR